MKKNKNMKVFEANAIEFFCKQDNCSPTWQRPISWGIIHIVSFINEWMEFAIAPRISKMRMNEESSMFMFVTYMEDGVLNIADGQSRATGLMLFIKAFNDFVSENNIACKELPTFKMMYKHPDANKAFVAFNNNHELKRNNYAVLYRYCKERIQKFYQDGNDLRELYDVMLNNVSLEVRPCENEPQAHEAFLNINTGGLDLTKNQIIDSILKYYSSFYSVQLEYNVNELEEIVAALFYVTTKDDTVEFSTNVIHDFMKRTVVSSALAFQDFRNYLLRIKAFKANPWYQIMTHIDREKSIRVAYALLARNKNMQDDNVQRFMSAVYEYDIISLTRGSNTGGSTSTFFKKLMCSIGKADLNIDNLIQDIVDQIKVDPTKHQIRFEDLDVGLDRHNNNVHKSLLLYIFAKHNANSLVDYERIQEEHAFAQTNSAVWISHKWPSDEETRKVWIDSIGNKFLLDKETNNRVKNQYIVDKGIEYEIFFNANAGLSYPLNRFDATAMEEKRYDYILERRKAFATYLANTPIGKLMVV